MYIDTSASSRMTDNKGSVITINGGESAGNSPPSQRKSSTSESPPELRILCFDLTYYNRTTQFLLSCAGVFFLYILYGYLQELIFTVEGFKPYGWFLTLVQFGYYIGFGLVERRLEGYRISGGSFWNIEPEPRCIPMRTYLILAALTLGTMGLSNSSLGYLNYPTQVIFKCCKLIPVLVGSILIQGKRYGLLDFAAATCMCIGLAWFTLADSQMTPNFNLLGVAMISGALLATQPLAMSRRRRCGNSRRPAVRWCSTHTAWVLCTYL